MKTRRGYKYCHALSETAEIVAREDERTWRNLGKPSGRLRQKRIVPTCDKCGNTAEFLHAEGEQKLCNRCLP